MGGGHHGIPKVPDASTFVVEGPKLLKLKKRLEEKGLKDPWMRNYVWRYEDYNKSKLPNWTIARLLVYGWKFWVPLVGLTIAVEKFLGIDYSGHDHGHGNHENGHHENGHH